MQAAFPHRVVSCAFVCASVYHAPTQFIKYFLYGGLSKYGKKVLLPFYRT